MGKPRRTPFEAMETMATLTAINKSSQCLTTTTSTCKASPHGQELIASKSGTNGIDSLSFPNRNILREIPTRNSCTTWDTTIIEASNNDNDHHQHQPPLHSWTNVETTNHALLLLTPPCDNGNSFDYRLLLAELTAECNRMMQCWLLTVNMNDQGPCTVNHNALSPSISLFPPTDPYPRPTNMNPTMAVLCHDANYNTTIDLAHLWHSQRVSSTTSNNNTKPFNTWW